MNSLDVPIEPADADSELSVLRAGHVLTMGPAGDIADDAVVCDLLRLRYGTNTLGRGLREGLLDLDVIFAHCIW